MINFKAVEFNATSLHLWTNSMRFLHIITCGTEDFNYKHENIDNY